MNSSLLGCVTIVFMLECVQLKHHRLEKYFNFLIIDILVKIHGLYLLRIEFG